MLIRLCVALCLEMLCRAECVSHAETEYGRVVFEVFTSLGEPLENAHIEFRELGSRKNFTSAFRGNVATRIPYGFYDAHIVSPGFASVTREIRVFQPETSIRAELRVSMECGEYASLQGTIEPAPGDHLLWAKVVPFRGTGGIEVPIASDGKFSVGGLDGGKYLIMVLDNTYVIRTQTVEVIGNTALTVYVTP